MKNNQKRVDIELSPTPFFLLLYNTQSSIFKDCIQWQMGNSCLSLMIINAVYLRVLTGITN